MKSGLPIDEALPALIRSLASNHSVVLQAPPGAGKSTVVPLALLEQPWMAGMRLLLLEPRRLAARAVAHRMAQTLGQAVGGTVGYRMRMDTRVSRDTRVEVVTEGVLTRMLQVDPSLEGIAAVIFDEYHERSLQADLGLALAIDARSNLSPELKIVVMSATLDGEGVAELLGNAPMVTASGRMFPVESRFVGKGSPLLPPVSFVPGQETLEALVGRTVVRALREEQGDVLVFLPGAREIRRVQSALASAGLESAVRVLPLFGELSGADQEAALEPAKPGTRKVVLATNIAETSLTIQGVRVVVDSGLVRRSLFDPSTGMSRLQTVRISRASAEQRQGRAGRLEPGVCYRLWSEGAQRSLAPFTPAEIVEADLAPLALELASWGARDATELRWLDVPPAAMLSSARDLLSSLGALDTGGRITPHGRRMAGLSVHPRLAHMLIWAEELGSVSLAADLAALLSERDLLRTAGGARDADIRGRLDVLRGGDGVTVGADGGGRNGGIDRAGADRARRSSKELAQQVRAIVGGIQSDGAVAVIGSGSNGSGRASVGSGGASMGGGGTSTGSTGSGGWGSGGARHVGGRMSGGPYGGADTSLSVGILLAFAYPDRIGRRRSGTEGALYTFSNGRGAHFAEVQSLAKQEFIVAVDLDDRERDARILLAAPLGRDDLETHFADQLERGHSVAWDSREQAVIARRFVRFGAVLLEDKPLQPVPADKASSAMLAGVREMGLDVLPWTRDARDLQARMEFVRKLGGGDEIWPPVSDEALASTLETWLSPWLDGITRRDHLARLSLTEILRSILPWEKQRQLDELAPTHFRVPSGSNIRIDYLDESAPAVSVRLQEAFGLDATPRIGNNRVPLTFKLLSPAQRPVQVTRDLASFWRGSYAEVRKDMRGRYPKHYWPSLQELNNNEFKKPK